MKEVDHALENLLMLDGECIVVDDELGLWVKFEVKKTDSRAQGIRYSLSLHDKNRARILGFDNCHEIKYGAKHGVKPMRTFDHWHFDSKDKGRPYKYVDSAILLVDFWTEVDRRVKELKEE